VLHRCTGSSPSVLHRCTGSSPSVLHSCTGSSPSVLHRCTGSSPSVLHRCSGSSPSVLHRCSGSSPSVLHRCSGSSPSVLHRCSGSSPGLKWLTLLSLHTVSFSQCALEAAASQIDPASFRLDSLDFCSFNHGLSITGANAHCPKLTPTHQHILIFA
ncbi:unnamed protein product, partial [Staurois parvus]